MARGTDRFPGVRRLVFPLGGILLALLALGGCTVSPFPTNLAGWFDGLFGLTKSQIAASVVAAAPETGLPTALSGVVSGRYEGTYQEEMLEVYFGDGGVPIAALSRSQFTVDSPGPGTLTSLNLIVVVDTILLTDAAGAPVLDAQGAPIPSGLRSSSTGTIIHGTGIFEGATGELHTESVLLFSGGDSGMGALDAELTITLDGGATG